MIEVEGLSIGLGQQRVIEDLHLTVERGEIVGIVGQSGAGKSVLLKTILGLVKPTAGHARVLGEDLGSLTGETRRHFLRRIGILYQEDALFSSMTVEENITEVIWAHVPLRLDLARELARLDLHVRRLRLLRLLDAAARQRQAQRGRDRHHPSDRHACTPPLG